jgi:hypothetical protein
MKMLKPAQESKSHGSTYIIEISRSKRKMYIAALKIPKEEL